MATPLELAFGKPEAAHWLKLQNAYELWQVKQNIADLNVQRLDDLA